MRSLTSIGWAALLVIVTSAGPLAGGPEIDDAHASFRSGVANKDRLVQARQDFSRAAELYLDNHQLDGGRSWSSSDYHNLGNAAVLAERAPLAIWSYHKGLRLDPNDRAMREHLAHARTRVHYPAGGIGRLEETAWPIWLHRPTLMELAAAFSILYSLACLLGTLALAQKNRRLLFATVVVFMLALTAGAWAAYQLHRADVDARTPIVVITENTPFYRGNGPSYPQHAAVPMLPRGLEARRIHQRGEWLQVRLSTGEVGWLPRGVVLIVEP